MSGRGRMPAKKQLGFLCLFLLVPGVVVLRYSLFRHMQRGVLGGLTMEDPSGLSADEIRLESQLRELESLDPRRVQSVVSELQRKQGGVSGDLKLVTLQDLNLDRAVPVNMRRGEGAGGEAGLWITLRDEQQRQAAFHVPEADLGPEDLRALRAFELIENTPMLHHIRPLLFESLLRTLPDE